jgi:hypothetical protein
MVAMSSIERGSDARVQIQKQFVYSTHARFGGRVGRFVISKTLISFIWNSSEPVKNVSPSSPVSWVFELQFSETPMPR